jgi:hypothetical protein
MGRIWALGTFLLLNAFAFCSSSEQLSFHSSFIADELTAPLATEEPTAETVLPDAPRSFDALLESSSRANSAVAEGEAQRGGDFQPSFIAIQNIKKPEKFHWGRALTESFEFLTIQHFYISKADERFDVHMKGRILKHYWSDWGKSLHTWVDSGWDDGDPFLDNYVAHPVQGALTGYIQVQNDPAGRAVEFSNTKAYWKSRLKAMAWATAYSVQFEIGPFSEMTVEKYGTFGHWTMPGHTKKVNGEGQVDLVVTPLGAMAWMLAEDYLDHKLMRGIENHIGNHFLINTLRCMLNPTRSGANVLHFKAPWYRPSRDGVH